MSNRVKSTPVNFGICLTRLIQGLYESFYPGLVKALNVWSQVLVAEEFAKEWKIAVIGEIELLKPLLDI